MDPHYPWGQQPPRPPNLNQLAYNMDGLNLNAQPFVPTEYPMGGGGFPQMQQIWGQHGGMPQYPYSGYYGHPNPHDQFQAAGGQERIPPGYQAHFQPPPPSHQQHQPHQPPAVMESNHVPPHSHSHPNHLEAPADNAGSKAACDNIPYSWEMAEEPDPPRTHVDADEQPPQEEVPLPRTQPSKPVPPPTLPSTGEASSAHAEVKPKKVRKDRDEEPRHKPHSKQTTGAAKYPKVKPSTKPEGVDFKESVNIIFIGHVDAGKSTIGGHVMFLMGMVDKRTLEKYEKEAKEINRESWYLSWALDTDQNERDKGKTVEVGRAGFETEKKRFTILDAPGHAGFVPNMITGTAQADVAILVISARRGEFETGFEKKGQTREHAILVKTAGIRHIVVLVNKMDDQTVKWDRDRFDEIQSKLTPFLKKVGFSPKSDIIYIPVSGLSGANLLKNTGECSFYSGPGFIEYLDSLPPVARLFEGPFRLPVMDKMKDMGTMVLGKIESGCLTPGQQLVMMPNKTVVELLHIILENDEVVSRAECGDNVRLRLKGIEEEEILPGFVLCEPASLCMTTSLFDVQIVILDYRSIISAGYNAVMHVHTCVEEVQVMELFAMVDKKTGDRSKRKPRFVRTDDVVICRLQSSGPICIENFKDFPQMGRFTLRDEGKTVAIGKILRIPQGEK